ncbi:hypothetical protein APED_24405 [Acanthopleuribacter pedis]
MQHARGFPRLNRRTVNHGDQNQTVYVRFNLRNAIPRGDSVQGLRTARFPVRREPGRSPGRQKERKYKHVDYNVRILTSEQKNAH